MKMLEMKFGRVVVRDGGRNTIIVEHKQKGHAPWVCEYRGDYSDYIYDDPLSIALKLEMTEKKRRYVI